ncbi:MAG: transglutaminase-like domain-containing protein [Candidatus Hodarchaeales archaeon]
MSTDVIDCDSVVIRKKTEKITCTAGNAAEKAIKIFYEVRDSIKYRVFTEWPKYGDFRASNVVKSESSFCIPKAILLVAMSRAVEIPARLHFANIRNHLLHPELVKLIGTDLMIYHGYAELYIYNKWVKVTPSFDLELCDKHGFVPVDFNGLDDAIFHQHDRNGRKHIEYVEDRGVYADFTREFYSAMIKDFKELYSSFHR